MSAQDCINWKTDYPAALAEARRDGKLLVVHMSMEGRPACASMEEETLRHPDVVRASRDRFVNVKIDVDKRPDFYRGTVGGRGGLATCVLDTTGDVVSALVGFAPAEDYVRFLDRAEKGFPALKWAREAAAAKPEDPGAMASLAEGYLALDSRRRAEECYEKILALGSKGVEAVLAHERLARLWAQRGDNREARRHLAECRRLDPEGKSGKRDRLLLTEALALSLERKHADAARLLEEGLRTSPKGEEADTLKFVLGFVLHQLPEDKRALEALEGLLRDHPKTAWARSAKEQIEHIKNPQPDHPH